MSETSIYKWWWDQTRKRAKKVANNGKNIQMDSYESKFFIPATDEFGGYSSRLRIPNTHCLEELTRCSDFQSSQGSELSQREDIFEAGSIKNIDDTSNLEQNLCELLGIDVEKMAKKIVNKDSEEESKK